MAALCAWHRPGFAAKASRHRRAEWLERRRTGQWRHAQPLCRRPRHHRPPSAPCASCAVFCNRVGAPCIRPHQRDSALCCPSADEWLRRGCAVPAGLPGVCRPGGSEWCSRALASSRQVSAPGRTGGLCNNTQKGFGWAQAVGRIRQGRVRRLERIDPVFVLTMSAHSSIRMRTLSRIRLQGQ